ncbi:MAG: ORF6N domain-containing protein [Acidobacteriota bacterium]|nr:ORF6N domain-containing protein [Acidobacteriota bacterium]
MAIPAEVIERKIYLIRGHRVMLDRDLADIYGVETRALVQAVKRNIDRFPDDFMFQLNDDEALALRSQFVILEKGRGRYPKYAPYAFTELGVAMLSSVLRSPRAVQMNILIMRAFVRLREMLASHKDLAHAIEEIRRRQDEQGEQITAIIETINQLLLPEPISPKRRIGFNPGEEPASE